MSTQAAPSIIFTHASPQQGFRLLELPPELADLISSNEAPTLELKSPPAHQPPSSSSSSTEDTQDSVNLCTPTRTYQIRQVQSSNSLHVLRPSNDPDALRRDDMGVVADGDGGKGTDMDADMDMDPMTGGMAAIAKCGSTLELHTPKEGFSAVPFLVKVVGVYHGSGGGEDGDVNTNTDMDMDTDMGIPEAGVRNALFADIPVSRTQCEEAWVDLCTFVLRRCPETDLKSAAGYCRRPSAKCKVGVWKRVVEGAVLQGIDLEKQFLVKDLWRSVLDDNGEEPFPRALFEAVVRRVCEFDAATGASLDEADLNWTSIDKSRCMQWVGSTYLEAMAPSAESALGRSEFLNAWKDNLPEAWTKEVALSKLPGGSYKNPDPTTICFNKDAQQDAKTSATGAAAATVKKTRNWHELFKNQRRR